MADEICFAYFCLCLIFQAELILELQKQLTLLGNEPKGNIDGGLTRNEPITSMITPLDKVCSFFRFLHGDSVVLVFLCYQLLLLSLIFIFVYVFLKI